MGFLGNEYYNVFLEILNFFFSGLIISIKACNRALKLKNRGGGLFIEKSFVGKTWRGGGFKILYIYFFIKKKWQELGGRRADAKGPRKPGNSTRTLRSEV